MPHLKSLYGYIVCVVAILYCSFIFYPKWSKPYFEAAISWDVSGYYWPLPSFFIYKDVKQQQFADSIIQKYRPSPDFQQSIYLTEDDKNVYIFRYSFGTSISYIPFFFVAHLLAEPLGYDADGFSSPYQLAVQISGCVWALIGLWYCRKLFLKYYSDRVVTVLLLLLCIGTNYLNYAAIDNGMAHSWLFTLYVLLISGTISFYEKGSYKYASWIGVLIGLIVLTRPTELIACIIPVLWGMNSLRMEEIKKRTNFLLSHYKQFLTAAFFASALIFIQLLYWKLVAGHWIMDTYPSQHFNFDNPHFMEYMFSYRSGWLVYTPMMIFAFAGLIPFIRSGKNRPAILLFFAVNLYIVASWAQWWYAGSGGRAMIQSYPILLFPVASCIAYAWKRNVTRWIFISLALLFAYVNIWFVYHAHEGKLYDSETMNKQYFWRVIGRWTAPEEFEKMKDYDEFFEGTPRNLKLIYSNDFENDTSLHSKTHVIDGQMSYTMDKHHRSSGWFMFPITDKAERLRVQSTYYCHWREWDKNNWSQLMVRLYDNDTIAKERFIYVDRYFADSTLKDIFIDVKIPPGADSAGVSFWGAQMWIPLYIDNLKAWTFDE